MYMILSLMFKTCLSHGCWDIGLRGTVLHFYIFKVSCDDAHMDYYTISGHYDCVHDWGEEFVVFKYYSLIEIWH